MALDGRNDGATSPSDTDHSEPARSEERLDLRPESDSPAPVRDFTPETQHPFRYTRAVQEERVAAYLRELGPGNSVPEDSPQRPSPRTTSDAPMSQPERRPAARESPTDVDAPGGRGDPVAPPNPDQSAISPSSASSEHVESLSANLGHEESPSLAGDTSAVKELTPEDRQEFIGYRELLEATGRTRGIVKGPGADFQSEVCGDIEYRLTDDSRLPHATWADGLNDDLGLAQDAKYVSQGATSFYRPDTLPPFLREEAIRDADDRLIKYREVITDAGNPVRGLEIITNHTEAASFFEERMTHLGIPGRVELHTPGDETHG